MRNKAETGTGSVGEFLFWGLNMILPLVAGALLYLLFCPETLLSQAVGRFVAVRSYPLFFLEGHPFRVFLRNYLFDFLWGYSLVFVLCRIVGISEKKILPVGLIAVGFAFLTETLQFVRVFPGTFDPGDLITEGAAAALGLLIIKTFQKRRDRQP